VNFSLAKRAGSPLRALARLPIFAAATLLFVVITGMIAKGGQGKARHLTIVEAGAGMGRAAATRYRAFYSSSASTLSVSGYDPSAVLDLVGSTATVERTFELNRSGARLFDFVTRPWETMVVREDGFSSLGGGVSLVAEGADVRVTNRLGRDLASVIIGLPDGSLHYFPEIVEGKSVRARSGVAAAPPVSSVIRPLAASRFMSALGSDAPGLYDAWRAIENMTGYTVDFWPHDIPVLIAEIRGADGRKHDAGLVIDRNRMLLRVVGYGGVP
jgi:hypothetical protein